MIELADWGGLTYYMVKEENPTKHIVLVKDANGNKATFNLETCEEITTGLDPSKTLPLATMREAKRMLDEFRSEFLEYWNNIKFKARCG